MTQVWLRAQTFLPGNIFGKEAHPAESGQPEASGKGRAAQGSREGDRGGKKAQGQRLAPEPYFHKPITNKATHLTPMILGVPESVWSV